MIVVPRPGCTPAKPEILAKIAAHVAKWQVPDDIVFVAELPHTATGKILKTALREQLKDYVLPTAIPQQTHVELTPRADRRVMASSQNS